VRAPGITYRFTSPIDTAGPSFEIFSRHLQISTGLVVLEQIFAGLSKDRILVLTNVAVRADPGATQNVIAIQIQGITQAGLNFVIAAFDSLAVADQRETLNWDGAVYIQGGGDDADSVRVFSSYDAGAVANTMTVGLHGIIIPSGNAAAF